MNESKRVALRVALFACFILGLFLFLFETQSTGEAPERFTLVVSSDPLAIGGAVVMVLALASWASLYLWERKRHLSHF
jgi:hypothetical protein